jgi:hypothetical protein
LTHNNIVCVEQVGRIFIGYIVFTIQGFFFGSTIQHQVVLVLINIIVVFIIVYIIITNIASILIGCVGSTV